MREIEIDKLKEQLCAPPTNKPSGFSNSNTSISLQIAMNRMEREADAANSKIKSLTIERDELKQNLKEILDEMHNDQLSYTTQISELTNKIKQLEHDNRFIRETQLTGASHESKFSRLTKIIEENKQELEELHSENRKLKNSYNQIK